MKTRPILFSAPMVRALLAGTKTQTRRAMKPQPFAGGYHDGCIEHAGWVPGSTGEPACARFSVGAVGGSANLMEARECPYGTAGDRLWVRESIRSCGNGTAQYLADGLIAVEKISWYWNRDVLPSIFMPRCASRLTLEITDVRVERLQAISEEDAKAEGLSCITKDGSLHKYGIPDRDGLPGTDDDGWPWSDWHRDPRIAYRRLWESINGAGSWDENPWVWALTFKRTEP